jgi:hypothetical protein
MTCCHPPHWIAARFDTAALPACTCCTLPGRRAGAPLRNDMTHRAGTLFVTLTRDRMMCRYELSHACLCFCLCLAQQGRRNGASPGRAISFGGASSLAAGGGSPLNGGGHNSPRRATSFGGGSSLGGGATNSPRRASSLGGGSALGGGGSALGGGGSALGGGGGSPLSGSGGSSSPLASSSSSAGSGSGSGTAVGVGAGGEMSPSATTAAVSWRQRAPLSPLRMRSPASAIQRQTSRLVESGLPWTACSPLSTCARSVPTVPYHAASHNWPSFPPPAVHM